MARDGGRWCWTGHHADTWETVTEFLGNLESQTWGELTRGGRHTTAKGIGLDQFPAETQRRLRQIFPRGDAPEMLWELHLGGMRRIWGMRREAEFQILWWDPNHEVYPTRPR